MLAPRRSPLLPVPRITPPSPPTTTILQQSNVDMSTKNDLEWVVLSTYFGGGGGGGEYRHDQFFTAYVFFLLGIHSCLIDKFYYLVYIVATKFRTLRPVYICNFCYDFKCDFLLLMYVNEYR